MNTVRSVFGALFGVRKEEGGGGGGGQHLSVIHESCFVPEKHCSFSLTQNNRQEN